MKPRITLITLGVFGEGRRLLPRRPRCGRPATYRLEGGWVLQHRFVELHMEDVVHTPRVRRGGAP